jgi:hypothetical protein
MYQDKAFHAFLSNNERNQPQLLPPLISGQQLPARHNHNTIPLLHVASFPLLAVNLQHWGV